MTAETTAGGTQVTTATQTSIDDLRDAAIAVWDRFNTGTMTAEEFDAEFGHDFGSSDSEFSRRLEATKEIPAYWQGVLSERRIYAVRDGGAHIPHTSSCDHCGLVGATTRLSADREKWVCTDAEGCAARWLSRSTIEMLTA